MSDANFTTYGKTLSFHTQNLTGANRRIPDAKAIEESRVVFALYGPLYISESWPTKGGQKTQDVLQQSTVSVFSVFFFYSPHSPTFSSTLFDETTFLKVCSSRRHSCQILTGFPPISPHFLPVSFLIRHLFGDVGLNFAEMYPAYPESHNGRRNFPSAVGGPGSGVSPLPKSYARSDRLSEDDQPWVPRSGHGGGSASVSARGQHRGGYEPHTGYHHASPTQQYPSQQYQPPYPQVVRHIHASYFTRSSF